MDLGEPGPDRIWYVGDAFAMGLSVDEVFALTKIDSELGKGSTFSVFLPLKSPDEITLVRPPDAAA